ncbi:hypothetical protein WJX74_007015 [Apatococcus lobatus]|uniref:Uncharacterized protein n=1 Tax=Apatococcus lobatus TaxID=904363 RepID=A0AAW1PYG5_9CHLO
MFGDSLSDDGRGANPIVRDAINTAQVDVGFFPSAPYLLGRFSNGPVWIETVATLTGNALENLATGNSPSGATTGAFQILPPFGYLAQTAIVPVPSSVQQAQSYVATHGGSVNPAFTYIVLIGSNDYVYTVNNVSVTTPAAVVQFIGITLDTLYQAGARKFVVLNQPPLGDFPLFKPPFVPAAASPGVQAQFTALVNQHNALLPGLISSFPASHTGATVAFYDLHDFYERVFATPAAFGISNIVNVCYQGPGFFQDFTGFFANPLCSNPGPEGYAFFDGVHPTKQFHAQLAADFVAQLRSQLS